MENMQLKNNSRIDMAFDELTGEFQISGTITKGKNGFYYLSNISKSTIGGKEVSFGQTFETESGVALKVKLSISDGNQVFVPKDDTVVSNQVKSDF